MRNFQLTELAAAGGPRKHTDDEESGGDMEDVGLLDSYYDREDNLAKIEEGMRRIQVRVTGMTCAACSNSVEGALMATNGVAKASVALLQNKADVVFDPNLVNVSLRLL